MNIQKLVLTLGVAGFLACPAHAQFSPGKLAVLRSGDNNPSPTWSLSVARQSPAFIDEFDPVTPIVIPTNAMGTNGPLFSVAIPTNDTANLMAMWFNGHAGSEGQLARSADNSVLTFTGYAHNINAIPGTPSSAPNLDRGVCVIQNTGTNFVVATGQDWYGDLAGQSNPRAAVTDGSNNFWGAGSLVGNLYYQPGSGIETLDPSVSSTRNVKIINDVLYFALQGGDSTTYAPGIYEFVDFNNHFLPLPEGSFAAPTNVLLFSAPYTTVDGYDINPQGTIAYTADTTYGIQRYEKSGGSWRPVFAFGFTNNLGDGQNTGCFGLVVDWTSANYPIVFATTTEGAGGSFTFSNRVVRLDDTNVTTAGFVTRNVQVTTLVTAWSGTTNMVFRGLAFTPDLRPEITVAPVGVSVVAPAAANFSVTATTSYPISYQWLTNSVAVSGQTASSFNTGATTTAESGTTVQVVVTDQYGSITSAPVILTVSATAVAPTLVSPVPPLNLTNAFGDTITIPITAAGTSPLTYQWYLTTGTGSIKLKDNGTYAGSATATLTITAAQLTNSGTYSVVIANTASSSSNIVSTNSIIALPPVIVNQPAPGESTIGGSATFTVTIFGGGLTAQWYRGSTALVDGTESGGGIISGSQTLTLSITGATSPQDSALGYYCIVTNTGGSVTTKTNLLTLIVPPPPSFVGYTNLGQPYFQSFDSLPIPNITANTANPITIIQDSNAVAGTGYGSYTYSLSSPYDFAFPIEVSGGIGGLGLSNTMSGWYGGAQISSSTGSKFGANFGDQTTGGQISYGALDSTNRALGILSTSTTGTTFFGVKFINETANTISNIDVSYIAELWHQQSKAQTLSFGYYIDPTAVLTFSTNGTTFLTNMNATFPIAAAVAAYDGTNPTNQLPLALTNYPIGNWTPGSSLVLLWEIGPNIGGSQGIAIDNFSFSAPYLYPVITNQPLTQGAVVGNNVTFNVGVSNSAYSVGYQWLSNGVAVAGATSSNYSITSVILADSGSYDVVVTNLYGSVTSAVAILTVSAGVVPVAITTPLLSQTNFIGASATFNVVATGGAPLSYFWFFNGAPITFDLTNSLVVSNLTLASNGTYSVIVSNAAGAALPSAAVLTVVPQIPSLIGPVAEAVQLGGTTAFSVTLAAGTPPVTYQWRTNGVNLVDGSGYTGSISNLLIITNAQYAQAASYSVVVGNAAGSITSAVVTLTVTSPLSYVAYTYAGQVYAQSFNSLPNPGLVSVNTANPATIATIAYSPASPFDFATSAPGGFGLAATMSGWYGSEGIVVGTGTRVGATAGDQTTGGVLSFGPTNSLTVATNRSLGLLATSTTGGTAFGVRILNQTGYPLTNMNVSYTSELWRQTATAKTVTNFYYIDPTGTNVFNTNNITAGLTNLSFTVGGTTTYGTNAPVNSTNMVFNNVAIGTNWTNGAALWLVWEMTSAAGSGQGLGIDNLVFTTGSPTLSVQATGTSVSLSWLPMFTGYTLQYNSLDISNPADWLPVVGSVTTNSISMPATGAQQFFRLKE